MHIHVEAHFTLAHTLDASHLHNSRRWKDRQSPEPRRGAPAPLPPGGRTVWRSAGDAAALTVVVPLLDLVPARLTHWRSAGPLAAASATSRQAQR